MKTDLCLKDAPEAKLSNTIDMGLGFSGMIRLFKHDEKRKLQEKLCSDIQKVFKAESEAEFKGIHSRFCKWGTREMILAKKKGKEETVHASYGQIAKTLNVVLKVTVYYCRLPNCKKSEQISRWLDAAVDTEMMKFLKKHYPEDIRRWPTTIKGVDGSAYMKIQETVHKFIKEKYIGNITPVQFDDIYWNAFKNRWDAYQK